MTHDKPKGLFITFEGAEGSGKSTQIRKAAAYLKQRGLRVLQVREPGGTRVGEAIREIILNKEFREMDPHTELLLYLAARTQIVREKILPALGKGFVVICDRFEDSTLAYQGFGRGIALRVIREISRLIVRGTLEPDLTIVLDIPPADGLKRGGRHDRIELEALSFHDRVRRGFLSLARADSKRYHILDSREEKAAVARRIREILDRVI
jgi:dTMP kinase